MLCTSHSILANQIIRCQTYLIIFAKFETSHICHMRIVKQRPDHTRGLRVCAGVFVDSFRCSCCVSFARKQIACMCLIVRFTTKAHLYVDQVADQKWTSSIAANPELCPAAMDTNIYCKVGAAWTEMATYGKSAKIQRHRRTWTPPYVPGPTNDPPHNLGCTRTCGKMLITLPNGQPFDDIVNNPMILRNLEIHVYEPGPP